MHHQHVKFARRSIVLAVVCFGFYTVVQRGTNGPPSQLYTPILHSPGTASGDEQVAEPTTHPPRELGGGAVYRSRERAFRVRMTACVLQIEEDRALPCSVYFPADTSGELPVILAVATGDWLTPSMEERMRRWARHGYLAILLQDATTPRLGQASPDEAGYTDLVYEIRSAIERLYTDIHLTGIHPARRLCLVSTSSTTAAMLTLAGVPVVRENGDTGLFLHPGVCAAILFDPSLSADETERLNLSAQARVPMLFVHASGDIGSGAPPMGVQEQARTTFPGGSRFPGGASFRRGAWEGRKTAVYQIGSAEGQHTLDVLFYRKQMESIEDADAMFLNDVNAFSDALLDGQLRLIPEARNFFLAGHSWHPSQEGYASADSRLSTTQSKRNGR